MWAHLCILPFNPCHLRMVVCALATAQCRCVGPLVYFIFHLRGVASMLLLDPHNFLGPASVFYHLIYAHSVGLLAYCTFQSMQLLWAHLCILHFYLYTICRLLQFTSPLSSLASTQSHLILSPRNTSTSHQCPHPNLLTTVLPRHLGTLSPRHPITLSPRHLVILITSTVMQSA